MDLSALSATRDGKFLVFLILALVFLPGCPYRSDPPPVKFSYIIVNSYPHDPQAFTQGLAWDRGKVYEGTGLFGRSSLRLVDLETGAVTKKIDYEARIFAEGITVFRDRIYQLTWKNNIVFAYDKNTFSPVNTWHFAGDGWGITHDNRNLIVSDGSPTLCFLDPDTLAEKRRITVHDQAGPVSNLNELEYINGTIFANIWKSERIAIIDPESGGVEGWIDLSRLRKSAGPVERQDVLNGIMYNPEEDRLFVTGKRWPALFEIRLIAAERDRK